ncbi:transposase family protein [Leptospira interrogans]|uniref:DDE family endonuclease domain protein n=6 Tax=Leptospira interrogans TaxID=173 RepID=A0A829DAC6_LEPIR|nr:transposase family protein [Leptospira interrogans]EKN86281.1 DDE family endonuclease domain protein [Leptospira interrogans str. 2002000624]EKQ36493.1 DDE family endonuclease domain protein [Leptospira interrogans str. 2002000621]EMF44754.1 DDE family endonuclease domain protein [Leptospira interrogans serovar Lora str. TE 1992]EMY05808.1 DDE family endonuclease domain protein [Leptospira interrogans str. 2002000626]EMY23429.1 DDE family endonuclease domain protein [Leptospira interrogans 
MKEEIKHNFTKGRKSILQDIEENLFFILFYLKTYPTYDVLGVVFKMEGLLLVSWKAFGGGFVSFTWFHEYSSRK